MHSGGSFDIPLKLSRSAKLPEEATVELDTPNELTGLLKCDAITLPTEDNQGVLRVTTVRDAGLVGPWNLRIKATALQDDKWPAISITHVPVVVTGLP